MRLQRWALTICSVCLLGIAGCATMSKPPADLDQIIGSGGGHDNILRLATQGNGTAQNTAGLMYQHGRGVTQSDQEALKWYRLAADQGDAYAQNNLGQAYMEGELGLSKNYREALKLFLPAAEKGLWQAQASAGALWYRYGDYQEALKWRQRAAAQGHGNSQFALRNDSNLIRAALQQQQYQQPQQYSQPKQHQKPAVDDYQTRTQKRNIKQQEPTSSSVDHYEEKYPQQQTQGKVPTQPPKRNLPILLGR